jgi:hypothetical protein
MNVKLLTKDFLKSEEVNNWTNLTIEPKLLVLLNYQNQ